MKKIILKKTVVANLNKDGMNALKGGGDTICDYFTGGGSGVTCESCAPKLTCVNCLPEIIVTPK